MVSDLYGTFLAMLVGLSRQQEAMLAALDAARATVDGGAAAGSDRRRAVGWLRAGTFAWVAVALAVLTTAALMGIFARLSRP